MIATHASTTKRAKVLLSLSVIAMTEDNTTLSLSWSVTDVDIPDIRRSPVCVGCAMVCGEIVGIIRTRSAFAKKGRHPKWVFCVMNLQTTKAAPPSPDLLADGDDEMTAVVDSSPGTEVVKNILIYALVLLLLLFLSKLLLIPTDIFCLKS